MLQLATAAPSATRFKIIVRPEFLVVGVDIESAEAQQYAEASY